MGLNDHNKPIEMLFVRGERLWKLR